jgi:hypothetical protein
MTGPFDPPPFRLEEYLGIWEFSGEHYLTASDAETLTIEELLAFADPDQREEFHRLPLSYAPTWGGEELRAPVPRRRSSGRCRSWSGRATTPW